MSHRVTHIYPICDDLPWTLFLKELHRMRVLPKAFAHVDQGKLYLNLWREEWQCHTTIRVYKWATALIGVTLVENRWPSPASTEIFKSNAPLHPSTKIYLNKVLDAIARLVRSYKAWERRNRTRSG